METNADFKGTSTATSLPVQGKEQSKKAAEAASADLSSSAARMATIQDDDERLLAQIGYKQVFFEPETASNITLSHHLVGV